MIRKISNYITDSLIENRIINENERCLYFYCIEGLVEVIGNVLITLIIGTLLGKIFETALFLVIFIPLRSLVGGFHVKNENVCFILSIAIFIEILLSALYLQESLEVMWSIRIYIVSMICILLIAPVDCKNKRLNKEKNIKLKKIILVFSAILSIVFLLVLKIKKYNYCFIVSNTTLIVTLLLIIGYIKNIFDKDYHSGA